MSLWRCGQGASLVHHIHGPHLAVGFRRRHAVQSRVGPLSVVEADPLRDDPFGLEVDGIEALDGGEPRTSVINLMASAIKGVPNGKSQVNGIRAG